MAAPETKISVKRGLTFATGLLECLCFAGAVFGWASLVFVLKKESYFSSMCVNITDSGNVKIDCSAQDEQFSLIFTIASFANNFLTLPNGFIFDRFGTTVIRLFGTFLYTLGTLLVSFSTAAQAYILFPAIACLAVGGIVFLMTNIQVGNLFGSHRSTIITLYNGAFDSSSALFLVIKLMHESGVSLRTSFLILSFCSIAHVIRTIFLMPKKIIPYPLPDHYSYGLTCGKSPAVSTDVAKTRGGAPPASEEAQLTNDVPVTKELSFKDCLLSRFFAWQLVWLSVMQLRHYLFIGTLNPMLQRLTDGDPALISQYTNAFAITQLCGVLCAPWNGLIIDRHRRRARAPGETDKEADLKATIFSLFLTALQCLLFSVCASTPILPLQYLTFILQVLNRSFLYGGNAAFLSVAFPPAHFGKLYGLIMALSAVFSLLQYPCFMLVKDALNGDPLYVNIALTLLSLLAFIHPFFVHLHCRHLAAQRRSSN